MYSAKYLNRKKCNRKSIALLVCLVLMMTVTITGTLAFLADDTTPVLNTFTPSSVPNVVVETFQDNIKTNVAIQNTGNTDAFVRAAVVFNWVDAEGNISAIPVQPEDYSLIPGSSAWVLGKDGYYYYSKSINAGAITEPLFQECTENSEKRPDGFTLSMEIMGQTIQAKGVDNTNTAPVILAWGTKAGGSVDSVSGTTLTIVQ